MKKSLIALSMLFAFTAISCQKAEIKTVEPQQKEVTESMTFKIAFESNTKASISEGKVSWTEGDQVTVYDSEGNFETVTVSEIADEGATATIKTTTLAAGKSAYFAVYPNDEAATIDGDNITVGEPYETQTNAKAHIAVAKAADNTFSFKNINHLIKFTVSDTDIKWARFESNTADQTVIYSTVKVDATTGEFVEGETAKTSFYKQIESGDNYIALVPGITMTSGFTITLEDDSHSEICSFNYDKAFTTTRSKISNIKNFEMRAKYIDLSEKETANCYIVPAAGSYMFKATVKGNGTDAIETAAVKYLWSTYNSNTAPVDADQIIKNISFENGYATFEATGKPGNVIVAAYDSENNILWSWHIWSCAGITNVVHQNAAGKLNGQTMIDRNLGALSNIYSDDNVDDFGFFYEWGRKDPFVAASVRTVASTADITYAAVHGVAKTITAGKKSLEYAIAHPTEFITSGSSTGDWIDVRTNTLWGATKTIYDPCPVGYSMPTTNAGPWGLFTANTTWNSTYKGREFTNKDGVNVWHPAMGFTYCTSGKYSASNNSLGVNGKYWSYYLGDYAETGKAYRWHEEATTCSLDGEFRASGIPVRCQKK